MHSFILDPPENGMVNGSQPAGEIGKGSKGDNINKGLPQENRPNTCHHTVAEFFLKLVQLLGWCWREAFSNRTSLVLERYRQTVRSSSRDGLKCKSIPRQTSPWHDARMCSSNLNSRGAKRRFQRSSLVHKGRSSCTPWHRLVQCMDHFSVVWCNYNTTMMKL